MKTMTNEMKWKLMTWGRITVSEQEFAELLKQVMWDAEGCDVGQMEHAFQSQLKDLEKIAKHSGLDFARLVGEAKQIHLAEETV